MTGSVRVGKSLRGTSHPRVQLLTIADLLGGRKVDLPRTGDYRTFKQSPKARSAKHGQGELYK